MYGLQASQLRNAEKQEKNDGAVRAEKVLPLLPQAYSSQGNEIKSANLEVQFRVWDSKERRLIGKPPVSKTGTAGSIPAAPALIERA